MTKKNLGLVGAGLIGIRHAEHIAASAGARLAAIADPSPAGAAAAARFGAGHYADSAAMLAAEALDGVIVAAPNQLHEPVGLACIAKGLPVLMEKPLADDLAGGGRLVLAAERAGVPLMVGHHRRFHPMVETAKRLIDEGRLGRMVAVNAMWAVRKPDDYFASAPWRTEPGGGPILINLIHDIDCLLHFCGPITEIHGIAGHAARGFAVEDTAAVALRFESGTLATVTLTDAAPSPWAWEAGSGENPNIAHSGQNCYRFLGSAAALDFPNLTLWRQTAEGPLSWAQPMAAETVPVPAGVPLVRQIDHFLAVIAGKERPRVSGRDGFATLAATLAVTEAARTGQPTRPRRLEEVAG